MSGKETSKIPAADELDGIRNHKIYVITGQLSIVAILVCVFYSVLFYFIHVDLLVYVGVGALILAISSRIAWQKGYVDYARFSLIIIGNAFIFAMCGSLGRSSGIYSLYFPLSCAILILYNLRQLFYLVLALVITFTCLIVLEFYDYSIFTITMPSARFLHFTNVFSFVFSFLVALACIYSMQKAGNDAEKTLAEAQERINGYLRELKTKNTELEHFAYIASHDLQEPVRTVSSLVDYMTEEYKNKLDETANQSFGFMKNAMERMTKLIHGLLDYNRIGRDTDMKIIDFNKLVQSVLLDMQTTINQTGAMIKVSNLPSLLAYETEVRLLFQNLISNAIKFRKPAIAPEINIFSETIDGVCRFAIKDNGIGMDPANGEKIFVMFQTLNRRSEYDGSGIGLAHCKKIVDLHKGNIWVESEPGIGSTFYFTLNT